MAALPEAVFDLAYLDPPFNTGAARRSRTLGYGDAHPDYLDGFLRPRPSAYAR